MKLLDIRVNRFTMTPLHVEWSVITTSSLAFLSLNDHKEQLIHFRITPFPPFNPGCAHYCSLPSSIVHGRYTIRRLFWHFNSSKWYFRLARQPAEDILDKVRKDEGKAYALKKLAGVMWVFELEIRVATLRHWVKVSFSHLVSFFQLRFGTKSCWDCWFSHRIWVRNSTGNSERLVGLSY